MCPPFFEHQKTFYCFCEFDPIIHGVVPEEARLQIFAPSNIGSVKRKELVSRPPAFSIVVAECHTWIVKYVEKSVINNKN